MPRDVIKRVIGKWKPVGLGSNKLWSLYNICLVFHCALIHDPMLVYFPILLHFLGISAFGSHLGCQNPTARFTYGRGTEKSEKSQLSESLALHSLFDHFGLWCPNIPRESRIRQWAYGSWRSSFDGPPSYIQIRSNQIRLCRVMKYNECMICLALNMIPEPRAPSTLLHGFSSSKTMCHL